MSSLPNKSEYLTIMENPSLLKSSELQGGCVVKRNGTTVRYVGGYCIVFPFERKKGKCAVRCWHAGLNDMQSKVKKISEKLKCLKLPYFVNFQYEPNGVASTKGIQPIVIMDWVDAQPLKSYIRDNIKDAQKIDKLAEDFFIMTQDFHRCEISHGDLQHGNIMVKKDDGSIVLVDYDSMYVPALKGYEEEIKGLEGYQPEARWKNKMLTPKADYFSEMVIYVSLKALSKCPHLWEKLDVENTETMLFSAEDIKSKGSSAIFNKLASIEELKPIIVGMKEAMNANNIEDIEPLEKYRPGKIDIDIGKIRERWGGDPRYVPPSKPSSDDIVGSTRKKW